VPRSARLQSALLLILAVVALFASAETLAILGFWLYLSIFRRRRPGLAPSSKPLGGGGVKSTNPDNLCRRTYSIRPIRLVLHFYNSFRSCNARSAHARELHRGTRNARSHGASL